MKRGMLFLLVFCFTISLLPFPVRVNENSKMTVYNQDNEVVAECSYHIQGWHFYFLFFKERYNVDCTINYKMHEYVLSFNPHAEFYLDDSSGHSWYMTPLLDIYDPLKNRYTSGGYAYFTSDLQFLCIKGCDLSDFKNSLLTSYEGFQYLFD